MTQLTVTVARKWREAEGICAFELAGIDGAPLPEFSAGSHIDVHIAPGLTRQYSLCNAPGERHRYQIAVLREPASRGGSVAMHERVNEGDRIAISEPRNHFPLVPAKRSLLLAGGIGITPILCMAERLATIDANFELHYCARSRERTAFLERIANALYGDRVRLHFDNGDDGQRLALPDVLGAPADSKHLYVCGPAGFIGYVTDTARIRGWSSDTIHLEYFAAAPLDHTGDRAFEVRLASSGRCVQIPANRSVTSVLADEGIDIPVSCEQGVCGTCLTGVLEGEPDHRDLFLTDDEKARNDQFTPCCSRAKSETLVLDL
jgi:vanillate O-demethylase ferredoxin subunit